MGDLVNVGMDESVPRLSVCHCGMCVAVGLGWERRTGDDAESEVGW